MFIKHWISAALITVTALGAAAMAAPGQGQLTPNQDPAKTKVVKLRGLLHVWGKPSMVARLTNGDALWIFYGKGLKSHPHTSAAFEINPDGQVVPIKPHRAQLAGPKLLLPREPHDRYHPGVKPLAEAQAIP